MAITVTKLADNILAEISGVDLTGPLDDRTLGDVRAAWLEHVVVVFRGQALTPDQLVRFSRRFGELKVHVAKNYRMESHPEIVTMTNKDKDGNFDSVGAHRGMAWHSDNCFDDVPAAATLMHTVALPDRGAQTHFANMALAYRTMPEPLRNRLDGRSAHFSLGGPIAAQSEDRDGSAGLHADHPAIRTHPETGRKSVYVNPYQTAYLNDVPREEGDRLLREVYDWCLQPAFRGTHDWRMGDTILWDNRCAWHSGSMDYPREQARTFWRTSIAGTPVV